MKLSRLFSGRRIVLPALAYVQLLTLLRNMLVARMLGPEQFGLAVTFLLVQQLIDSTTDTGLNKFILQSKTGNRPAVQATVQAIAVVRGIIIVAILLAAAWPAFIALGYATSVLPFLMLAAMSLAMGVLHYDNARQQRNDVFLNDSVSAVVGETCAFLAVLAVLAFTQSYIVAIVAIMTRAIAVSATSHVMARRRYVIRYSKSIGAAVMAFSLPLMINGPLLFVSSQADRLFVNAMLGLRELGIYSATLLLLFQPLSLLTRLTGAIFVPRLSAAFHAGSMKAIETEFSGTVLTLYLLASCGFAAIGPSAVVFFYGPAYGLHILPIVLIGLMQSMRFLRSWPVGLAIAVGRTGNLLLSNAIRLMALPMGFAGILIGDGITGLVLGLLAGEAIALMVSSLMLNRNRGLPLGHGLPIVAVAFAVSIILPLAIWMIDPAPLAGAAIGVAVLLAALAVVHAIDRRLLPRDLSAFGW